MKQSAWGRALRYYVRMAESYELVALAGGFFMALYVWLINERVSELCRMLPVAVLCFAMIILFSVGTSFAQYGYFIPVTFGCLRKYAFWGNLVMDGLFIAETLVFYLALTRLLDMSQTGFVSGLSLFLIIEGFSRFLGIASMKWGKAVYTIVLIGIVLFSMVLVFVLAYAGMGGSFDSFTFFFDNPMEGQWLLFGTGLIICVASICLCWRMLREFEVRS